MSTRGETPTRENDPPQPPTKSTVLLLLGDIADTTWRMFVPTLGGVTAGWWADSMWHTSPWLALAGLAAGICITAVLIRKQLKTIK